MMFDVAINIVASIFSFLLNHPWLFMIIYKDMRLDEKVTRRDNNFKNRKQGQIHWKILEKGILVYTSSPYKFLLIKTSNQKLHPIAKSRID